MQTKNLVSKLLRGIRYAHLFLRGTLILITVLILVNAFVITVTHVDGISMKPTLNDGDLLIVCKICALVRDPAKHQIVIIESENDDSLYFVKRIEGLPGDMVATNEGDILLEKDMFYALGDNRDHSIDSRVYGPVKKGKILGTVLFRK